MNIGFVPVRIGSKGIPKKNIKPLAGKPLIYWCLKALQDSVEIDQIWVASDSDEIDQVVLNFNFTKVKLFRRSEVNAQDQASTESVMLEFLEQTSPDPKSNFMLVQATNPFITASAISDGFALLAESDCDSVLSASSSKRFFWNSNGTPLNYDYQKRPRRQDFDGLLMENGAFYINTVENIMVSKNRLSGRIQVVEMPEYSGYEIDEPDDWGIVEQLLYRNILSKKESNKIKLLASDVDGVLTDAGMYYTETGDEMKKFNTRDGKGFELVRNQGIKTAIITSETTEIVANRAKKMKIDYLKQGASGGGKLEAIKSICEKEQISLDEVAYIGDDVNCKEILMNVGLAACPQDAVDSIKQLPNINLLPVKGGEGVVRYFIDYLILNK
ncbi:MAG: HAD hydrolase family protein [Reichenbachiella sp.]|uniref:cytidylyltransferase domain-containing protein n=1 Tax=Reichenbachiella sp. TaxID=2184521 RepID=UPI0032652C57